MKKINILFLLLIATVYTSGFRFNISTGSGGTYNISQLLLIFIIPYLVIKRYTTDKKVKHKYDLFCYIVLAYFVTNILSSALFSPNVFDSLKSCGAILTYVLIFFVSRKFTLEMDNSVKVLDVLYIFNILSMVFGVFFMFLSFSGIAFQNIGVSIDHVTFGIPSVRSFSYEPNLFSEISAVVGIFSIVALILGYKKYSQKFVIFLVIISILCSYTRSVYIAFPIALLSLLFFIKNRKRVIKFVVIVLVFLTISEITFDSDQVILSALTDRFSELTKIQEGSGVARMYGIILASETFESHPLFGTGTMSANTTIFDEFTGVPKEYNGGPGWLTVSLAQALNDTGLFGLIVLVSIFVIILVENKKLIFKTDNLENKTIFLSFFAGNVILLITCQISSCLFISFPWIYWGINSAFIYKVKNNLIN